MSDAEALVRAAYAAYDAQDAERLLALVHDDVDWPDDEGGRLRGKESLRGYWDEQWSRVRVHDDPREVVPLDDGRVRVELDQVVRDLDGAELSRGGRTHVLHLRDGRLQRLDVHPGRRPLSCTTSGDGPASDG